LSGKDDAGWVEVATWAAHALVTAYASASRAASRALGGVASADNGSWTATMLAVVVVSGLTSYAGLSRMLCSRSYRTASERLL
jgi:hypothetical protein